MLNFPAEPDSLDFDIIGSTALSTPAYSPVPSRTEISLDAKHLSPHGPSWVYKTKHMSIDLGRRLWGTSSPAYGLHDKIEGSIKLSGPHPELIEDISVTLEGNLVTTVLGDGGIARSNTLFMHHAIFLPLSSHPAAGDEYPFFISIPSEITLQGVTALTPPSFYRLHLGVTGEISYSLKYDLGYRKCLFSNLPSRYSQAISILYFPKTRPSDPPLADIPKPPSDRDPHFESPSVNISEHVDTFPLSPRWSPASSHAKHPLTDLEASKHSIFFSIPAPQSFASGEPIPFFLSLVFPDSPAQAALYTKTITVTLMKQLTVRSAKSPLRKLFSRSKSRLTSGHLETRSEYSEGVYLLRGWISAGELGRGCSWTVGQIARLQYFLVVEIASPAWMEDHIPSFHLEKEIEITTDCWETMNRELQSMGGVPTPALGLERCLLERESDYYEVI
ncbi:hypothetical protein EV368DRAFT_45971 [Lentinula lateritia]|uniref:Uncharacterized protein n=1 Tax=Lentinula aff. lateritia TaxID=2804960 RepID=A0ACC1UA57_9AGAR|nr:hypothetical protein F5876DRAFT_34537 [Lentinula aff. lateritia]KAJ3850118.1 hypothetical protein EV368DRAFT_45971 [Lentinula lateritia]